MNENTKVAADRWDWWQRAVKGDVGQMTTTPEQGFYRTSYKRGRWEPVALWINEVDGLWHARRNGRPVESEDIEDLWTHCCEAPVTHAAYLQAVRGEGWDDEPPPPAGHNLPDIADPYERLKLEFFTEREKAEVVMRKPVGTQAEADLVANWGKEFVKIANKMEAERKAEKQPFLEAEREVDAKWMPMHEEATAFVDKMRGHIREWLLARKREAEASAEPGDVVKSSAGRTGSKMSVRTERRAVITDYDACLAALARNPAVVAVVERLAQHAVRDGHELPGVTIELIEKVI